MGWGRCRGGFVQDAGDHLRRDPVDRGRGGVPGGWHWSCPAVPGRGTGQPEFWYPGVHAARVRSGHAREHHGREVRHPLPEPRGVERLQAHLLAVARHRADHQLTGGGTPGDADSGPVAVRAVRDHVESERPDHQLDRSGGDAGQSESQ